MKTKKEKLNQLENTLSQAHEQQLPGELSSLWRQGVMNEVRTLQAETDTTGELSAGALVFREMILPFTSAALLVAVALLVYAAVLVPDMEQDLLVLLTGDPSGLFSANIFGL